jgi:hypothetical protein
MCAFFEASVQEHACAILRRCFIASHASASHLLKVALSRLFGDDWVQELMNIVGEECLWIIRRKPDGPWDVYIVFESSQDHLPHLSSFRF